jgi:calcium permeable stress-gated cation channel
MGLYIAEICLIGLFTIRSAIGPVFLMLIFFIFTALVHVSLDEAVGPLLYNLPKTLAVEEQDHLLDQACSEDILTKNDSPIKNDNSMRNETPTGNDSPTWNDSPTRNDSSTWNDSPTRNDSPTMNDGPTMNDSPTRNDSPTKNETSTKIEISTKNDTPTKGEVSNKGGAVTEDLETFESQSDSDEDDFSEEGLSRAIEGAPTAIKSLGKVLASKARSKLESQADFGALLGRFNFWSKLISPDPEAKPNFILKWLHPEVYTDYYILRQMVPPDLPDPVYPDDSAANAYYPPAVVAPTPHLWIPRDPAGVSIQEIAHASKVIPITDEGVYLDKKNRMVIDLQTVRGPMRIDRIRF